MGCKVLLVGRSGSTSEDKGSRKVIVFVRLVRQKLRDLVTTRTLNSAKLGVLKPGSDKSARKRSSNVGVACSWLKLFTIPTQEVKGKSAT